MEDLRPSYRQAIWSQWRKDLTLRALDSVKALRSGSIGIVSGLIAARAFGNMETAANIALTTAASVGIAITVTMVVHLVWSWAAAPRRVYYSQEGKYWRCGARSNPLLSSATRRLNNMPPRWFPKQGRGTGATRLGNCALLEERAAR
jgi:hypothetical protein